MIAFTKESFEDLEDACNKIIAVSKENIDGSLMASQLMCLGEAITQFGNNKIVKSSGIVKAYDNLSKSNADEDSTFHNAFIWWNNLIMTKKWELFYKYNPEIGNAPMNIGLRLGDIEKSHIIEIWKKEQQQ